MVHMEATASQDKGGVEHLMIAFSSLGADAVGEKVEREKPNTVVMMEAK